MNTVAIAGGGIAGCLTALRLAQKHPEIEFTIFEGNQDILMGTSGKHPGRAGFGFHYEDSETGLQLQQTVIEFIEMYRAECPGLILDEDNPSGRGRYFIVKGSPKDNIPDSLFPADILLRRDEELRSSYEKNPVFKDEFFRVLDPKEYQDHVNMDLVEVGIETAERLINLPVFLDFIRKKIAETPNITVKTNTKVAEFNYSNIKNNYTVSTYASTKNKKDLLNTDYSVHNFDYIFNTTWEFRRSLDATIGHYYPPTEPLTNRLKVLLVVKLPQELENLPSMFFRQGPFCMFSNLRNGYGMMTAAEITNFMNSSALEPDELYQRYLRGEIRQEEEEKIKQALLAKVVKYIPVLAKVEPVELRFGTVQCMGSNMNINDPLSDIHQRRNLGITHLETGIVSAGANKFVYGQKVAEVSEAIFEEDVLDLEAMKEISSHLISESSEQSESTSSPSNQDQIKRGAVLEWMRRMPKTTPQDTPVIEKSGRTFAKQFDKKATFEHVPTIFNAKNKIKEDPLFSNPQLKPTPPLKVGRSKTL